MTKSKRNKSRRINKHKVNFDVNSKVKSKAKRGADTRATSSTNISDAKRDTKAWWRSLTAEQQADYRYSLMMAKRGEADWQKEYAQVIREGLYLK